MTRGTQLPLQGHWALVTGGARRIGAAVAATLHDAGCNIAVHYRSSRGDAEILAERLEQLRADSTLLLQADLLDIGAMGTMIKSLIEHSGRLDILINNASTFYPTPLETLSEAQWDDLMGTNLRAPLFLSQAALPHLRAGRGQIINVIDIHATRPLKHHTVYGPAKAGLAMLTRSLARDLAPDIRVNGVSPGAILWPEDGLSEAVKEKILRQVPMRRAGEPADIARCVRFLATEAPYVTGQIIAVDGGRSIGW